MPKMKSKRSAAKRFSFTGSGKVKRNHAFHRHNMTHKSQASKVGTRGTAVASIASFCRPHASSATGWPPLDCAPGTSLGAVIRPYHPSDRTALYRICLALGIKMSELFTAVQRH